MPLMCLLYLMTFADKTTLGQSAVLGIQKSAHLNQNQFNWLGTIFYLSYLVFQYPQNLALQYFPVGKWISINVLVWAIALCCHAACKSFGALFAVRFIMGICEGAITPGFLIVTAMFYTREEQTRRVGYWFLMNGIAVIFLGFVSYGVIHTTTHNVAPWQWLMIITGIITFITSFTFWFFFPDSPTTAHFLTPEERVMAVRRIRVNQAGVENKHWKREQFIEALQDSKTWIFVLFAGFANIVNSLTNQRQIIVHQFGFSAINTTLIGCVDGVVEIVTIWFGTALASYWPFGRAWAAIVMFVPAVIGSILVTTLPEHHKVALLFTYWLSIFAITPFVIFLSWVGNVTAGHTKRTTTNALVLIGYALGNAVGPFMWKAQYQPRNHVPWGIIAGASVISGALLFVARVYLARENAARQLEQRDSTFDDVYITREDADGKSVRRHVDKEFLDLTDKQNREYRYLL
ncbi:MFS general substrate transporter [Artomyces pyxidatus]|uniref:MFS general substrate transporter n=1 Tax=Artomyces pyxidatus TaxID=48021 RepID=A0ACB8T3W6_9AGAM|nr:MFS general substrate transporter [Artomyces pyxidatus]